MRQIGPSFVLIMFKKSLTRSSCFTSKQLWICFKTDAKVWLASLQEATGYGVSRFYDIGRTVGEGTFGVVRVGSSLEDGRKVAVKSTACSTELKVLTVLSEHPSPFVTDNLDIFEEGNHGFAPDVCSTSMLNIVMEYASGRLSNWLNGRRLSETKVKLVMRQVLSGLAHIHDLGIVHRDVKPDNILFFGSKLDQVKLADFGIATSMGEKHMHDQALRTMAGTPHFMAPEMWKGSYGPAVDIWACGITMYIMMTGRYPFGIELNEMIQRREQADFKADFSTFWDPDALSIAKGMLCPDPSRRLSAIGALQHKWFEPQGRASGHDTRSRMKFRKAVNAVRCINKLQKRKPKPTQQPKDHENGSSELPFSWSQGNRKRDWRWPWFVTKIVKLFRS